MCESRSWPISSPLTYDPAVEVEESVGVVDGASSSAVTIQGPIEVAKSLPLAGPRPTCISRDWMSRADQSLKIV